MNFTNGNTVTILTGKFAGQTATVVKARTDKNGVERIQVQFANGSIFSYLPNSLKNDGAVAATGTEANATATL